MNNTMKAGKIEELSNSLLEVAKGFDCITFGMLNKLIPEEIKNPVIIEILLDILQAHNIVKIGV
jgi:hypothetical protein